MTDELKDAVIAAARAWRRSGERCDCANDGEPWHAPTCPTGASYRKLMSALDAAFPEDKP